jgi:hypothetical protein
MLVSGDFIPGNPNCLGGALAGLTQSGGSIRWDPAANGIAEPITISSNVVWSSLNALNLLNCDVQVNSGVTLTSNQGGGNYLGYNGALTGEGNLFFPFGQADLKGTSTNTLSGKTTIDTAAGYNTLYLSKSGGATAIAGDLDIRGSQGRVLYNAGDQIADSSAVLIDGANAELEIGAYSDTVGFLTIANGGMVDTTGGGVLTVHGLIVDGSSMGGGIYTSSTSPSWIAGEGSVVYVPSGTAMVVK